MKLGIGTKLIVFAVAVALFVGFAATLPAEAQTGEDGPGNVTVLVLDNGDAGSTITAPGMTASNAPPTTTSSSTVWTPAQ